MPMTELIPTFSVFLAFLLCLANGEPRMTRMMSAAMIRKVILPPGHRCTHLSYTWLTGLDVIQVSIIAFYIMVTIFDLESPSQIQDVTDYTIFPGQLLLSAQPLVLGPGPDQYKKWKFVYKCYYGPATCKW
ncbi:hypothetical protein EV421DRAFT_1742476 [Armillaria borealis]|uniref:Uncharacterized protein n=1 Tax=Armillaria borealis TaxID=47425 RepID=A0AA39J0G9_9AGAR|nr:hypothetical protein EV421DRAFT_1742476 [Armillaria borealis]